ENGGTAPRRLQQAQDHADGRRLAGAVAADESEDTAARHTQGNGIDRALAAEVPRQAACLDHRSARGGGGFGVCSCRENHGSSPAGLVSISRSASFWLTTSRISSAVKSKNTASWTNASTA